MIDMNNIITYEGIRAVHRSEKLETLGKLPEGFWPAVRAWLATREERKDSISLLEIESAKKLLEDVISRRQRKIIFAALGASRGGSQPANMTPEEQQFFDQSILLLKQNKESSLEKYISAAASVEQKIEDARKSLEEIRNAMTAVTVNKPVDITEMQSSSSMEPVPEQPLKALTTNGTRMVKILSDMPKFVGTDMNEYGPFKLGDVVKLPSEIRAILVARNAAEIVLE